jgi:hypothetical protein
VGALVGSYISYALIGTLGFHSTPCSSAIFSRYTDTFRIVRMTITASASASFQIFVVIVIFVVYE